MNLKISAFKTDNINKNGVPTFKKRQYLAFKEIKYLSGLNCACCGKDLITGPEMHKLYIKITKPLKMMLERGCFNAWKKSQQSWALLNKFATENPKSSLDQIISIEDTQVLLKKAIVEDLNTEVSRGEAFYNKRLDFDRHVSTLFTDLLRRSRTRLRSASVVMKRLAPFKELLTGHKKNTLEQLQIYARKYPRKSLQEIINMEEVYRFHQQKDLLQRAELREKMDFYFENILLMVKKQNPNAVEIFEDLKLEAIDLLELEKDAPARIPKMKAMYEKALKENNCEKLIPKVNKELDRIPISFITTDSFLVYAKNHRFNDGQIISSLLAPQNSSFEHIVPLSAGGLDVAENGIVLCRDCNTKRGSMHYSEFMQYHPMMPYYTQKQINKIAEYILDGSFEFDKSWPIKVSKTLHDYTNGKISPDYSEYSKKLSRKSKKNIEK